MSDQASDQVMEHEIKQIHTDKGGGHTEAVGLDIWWQDGVLVDGKPNGAFVETVIRAAIGRLEHFQSGAFPCKENEMAITRLNLALECLAMRRADRERRRVLNSYNP